MKCRPRIRIADKTVIRSLLMGDHPWLMFPEGSMIKDKKIIERGKFLIYSSTEARRPPPTGAARVRSGNRNQFLPSAHSASA